MSHSFRLFHSFRLSHSFTSFKSIALHLYGSFTLFLFLPCITLSLFRCFTPVSLTLTRLHQYHCSSCYTVLISCTVSHYYTCHTISLCYASNSLTLVALLQCQYVTSENSDSVSLCSVFYTVALCNILISHTCYTLSLLSIVLLCYFSVTLSHCITFSPYYKNTRCRWQFEDATNI